MQYQTVIIELSDGTVGTFTGPALIFPDGSGNPPTIVGMKFTEPHDREELPEGASFELRFEKGGASNGRLRSSVVD